MKAPFLSPLIVHLGQTVACKDFFLHLRTGLPDLPMVLGNLALISRGFSSQ